MATGGDILWLPAKGARAHAKRRSLAYLCSEVSVAGRIWRPITLETWQALATFGNAALAAPELKSEAYLAIEQADAWQFLWLHFPHRWLQAVCPTFVGWWIYGWCMLRGWGRIRLEIARAVQ